MSSNITDAIKRSMLTEKSAMDFYDSCASLMKNTAARKTFELLAREEREHAESFFQIYDGDDLDSFDEFMLTKGDSEWLSELEKLALPNMDERKAMELAMEKEQQLEKHLRAMAAKIDDADVKAVYEANAKSTHNHYVMIESEYARLMGMVHETDIDTFVRE
ncbi:MAG: ferritin family protein [Desulfuromonadales bacterium]|nr:ferritin family protein [Desulfuromonadales bacterium]